MAGNLPSHIIYIESHMELEGKTIGCRKEEFGGDTRMRSAWSVCMPMDKFLKGICTIFLNSCFNKQSVK